MSVTVKIFLDERRIIEKTQTFPIKLRVTYKRKSTEFETIHSLAPEDFAKLKAPRISDNLKQVKSDISTITTDSAKAAKGINPFNIWTFTRDYIIGNSLFVQKKFKQPEIDQDVAADFDFSLYYSKFSLLTEEPGEFGSIKNVFASYIRLLLPQERIGTAKKYQYDYNALRKFGGDNILFTDITVTWLYRCEAFMLGWGRNLTSVGITMRSLRCMFNEAHHLGIINKAHNYPFGRRKYLVPNGSKVKKALSAVDIGRIYYNEPLCDAERYAKALWFFCYFGNGLNVKDLVNLKYGNINGEYLTFQRSKTLRTSRSNPQTITVFLNEDMIETIRRYGKVNQGPDTYIFDCLSPEMDALKQYEEIPRFTKVINAWMKKIGYRLDLDIKPTTIVTRHSFSTIMKRSGVSTEFIQEALGHANIRTTENYLDSFENETKKINAQNLMAFKSSQLI